MSKPTLKSEEITMLLSHLADIVELMNQEIDEIGNKLETMQKRIEVINRG